MRVLQFLRETYSGDEYLIEENGVLKRMKVLKPEVIGISEWAFANYVAVISRIKHPGIVTPESFDLRGKPVLYFPYVNAAPLGDPRELDLMKRRNLSAFALSILREFLHHGIAIPVLSLDDFLVSEGFMMMPPFWFNYEKVPEGDRIFVAPEFKRDGSFSVFSTAYVIAKLVERVCEDPELIEFVREFIDEDPLNRKAHFSLPVHLVSGGFGTGKSLGLQPVLIKRSEADRIVSLLQNNVPGLKTVFVVGPQRSGKTTLLEYISTEARRLGWPVIWARTLDTFFLGILQLLSNEDYNCLDKVDQDAIETFVAGKHLPLDQLILTLGKILNRLPRSVILIDDVHEIEIALRSVIVQLQSLRFESQHVLIMASSEPSVSIESDFSVELQPFDYSATQELVSRMLKVPQDGVGSFCRWLYAVTQGLVGKIVEVLKLAIKFGALTRDGESLRFDPTKVAVTEFGDLFEKELDLEKYKATGLNLVALCGEKFELDDFETLLNATEETERGHSLNLAELLQDGILFWESGRYRFIFREVWEKIYATIDPQKRQSYHVLLANKLQDPAKKAWHVLMLGHDISAAALLLLAARNELRVYNDISRTLSYLEEAEKLLSARKSYALMSLRLQALLIKQDSNLLERFALSLEGNPKYQFELYVALVAANKISLAHEMEKKHSELFEAVTDYGKLKKLCWRIRRMLSAGEEVPQELVKQVNMLLSKLGKGRLHMKLRAEALLMLARIRLRTHQMQALELLNKVKSISEKNGFMDLLSSSLITLASSLAGSQESIRLYEQIIEIGHRLGSAGMVQTALSNIVWMNLYRGEIDKMFSNMSRLRQLASLTGRLDLEAYSYFVEGNYHTYNHELESAVEDFSRELAIEKYLGIEQRALRGFVAAYAINDRFEEAVKIIKENLENPAMKNRSFAKFRDLFLAESDEMFYKAWMNVFYSDDPYWKEETCQVFGARLMRLDREGFIRFFEEFEVNNIRNGMYLSLAQMYEGLALAYQSIGEIPASVNYAEKAVSIYRAKNLENAAKWLERKINVTTSAHRAIAIIEDVRKKLDQNLSNLLATARNLIQHTVSFQNLAQYALDTLKVVSAQDQLLPTLEFLAARLMSLLPLSSLGLVIKDPKGRIVERVVYNLSQIPESPHFSYAPLEICTVTKIYEDYSLILYVGNETLYLEESAGTDFVRMLINMQEIIVHILKNIFIYQQSITDPLTGLYNRRYFMSRLTEEFERINRYGGHFSVVMADIDDFKKINDNYGHETGDEVLRFISSVLRSSVRSTDILGRYGGEEFLLILLNTPKQSAITVAEKILRSIIEMNPFEFKLTLSLGVAGYPEDPARKPEDLVIFADKAMYISKERGKCRVTPY